MADVIKKATREGYGEALAELGAKNPNVIVMDADLAAATKTGVFKKAFPDRFINAGIAEVVYGGDYTAFLDTVKAMFREAGVKFQAFAKPPRK